MATVDLARIKLFPFNSVIEAWLAYYGAKLAKLDEKIF